MKPVERMSRENFVKTSLKNALAYDAQAAQPQKNETRRTIGYHVDHPEDCCVESVGEDSICGAESENSLFGSSALVNRIVGFIGSLVVTGAVVSAASSSRLDMTKITFVISVLKHSIPLLLTTAISTSGSASDLERFGRYD
jgi:hypothetical protein